MHSMFPKGFQYSSAFLRRSAVGKPQHLKLGYRAFASSESSGSKQQAPLKATEGSATSQQGTTTQATGGKQQQQSGRNDKSPNGDGSGGGGGAAFLLLATAGAGAAAYYYSDELGLSKYIENLVGKPAPEQNLDKKAGEVKTKTQTTQEEKKLRQAPAERAVDSKEQKAPGEKSTTTTAQTAAKKSSGEDIQTLKNALSLAEQAMKKEKEREKQKKSKVQSAGSPRKKESSQSAVSPNKVKESSESEPQQSTTEEEQSTKTDTAGIPKGQSPSKEEYTTDKVADKLREEVRERTKRNVNKMSESELRERVLLLTEELSERSKWEAIRINEFLRAQEDKWHHRFGEFADEQRQALQAEIEREKSRLRREMERENNEWRNRELQRMSHEVEKMAQSQLGKLLQEVKEKDARQTQQRLQELERIRGNMEGISEGLAEYHDRNILSNNIHRISTSCLHLIQEFEYGSKRPLTDQIAAIEVAGKGSGVIVTALSILPQCVHSPKGPPTRQELFTRLDKVLRSAEAAALTPHGSGVVGHAVGTVTSSLLYKNDKSEQVVMPPQRSFLKEQLESMRENIVSVVGSSWDSNAEEAASPSGAQKPLSSTTERLKEHKYTKVFQEATDALHKNDLAGVLKALEKLEGYAAVIARDWKKEAKDRLLIEHCMRLLKAETTCLTASVY